MTMTKRSSRGIRAAAVCLTLLAAGCASGSSHAGTAGAPSPSPPPLALAASPQALGFASPLPGTLTAPGPTPAVLDYNVRLGSNRPAAEAALVLSRDLFTDGSFWEVYVKTTPAVITTGYDPTDPSSYATAGRSVTTVDLVMATESGVALSKFRAGGHDHERAVMTRLLGLLQPRFPSAHINFNVYFGETDHHASGSYDKGHLDYKVLDTL